MTARMRGPLQAGGVLGRVEGHRGIGVTELWKG